MSSNQVGVKNAISRMYVMLRTIIRKHAIDTWNLIESTHSPFL